MNQPFRHASAGLVDRDRPLRFRFDGRDLTGFAGDTLASALLANGVHEVGRSTVLGRPRGIVTAGPEEPSALVRVESAHPDPMWAATAVELHDGLVATGLAGRGRLADGPDPGRYDAVWAHADILVVGAGPAGVAAVRAGADGWGTGHHRRLGRSVHCGRARRCAGVVEDHDRRVLRRQLPGRRAAAGRPVRSGGAGSPRGGTAVAHPSWPSRARHRRARAAGSVSGQRPAGCHAGRCGADLPASLRSPGGPAGRGLHEQRHGPGRGGRARRGRTGDRRRGRPAGRGPDHGRTRRAPGHRRHGDRTRRRTVGRRGRGARLRRLEPGGRSLQPGRRPAPVRPSDRRAGARRLPAAGRGGRRGGW